MLQTAAIVFCDWCECATARCERGWRAYVVPGPEGAPDVSVLCPDCAEWLAGEDEAEYPE